jgi:hypothetical protein
MPGLRNRRMSWEALSGVEDWLVKIDAVRRSRRGVQLADRSQGFEVVRSDAQTLSQAHQQHRKEARAWP